MNRTTYHARKAGRYWIGGVMREGGSVLLACAEPGREYMIRWASVEEFERALAAQS